MSKRILLLIFTCISFVGFAQLRPDSEGLVSIQDFMEETKMTKKMIPDSALIIRGNDTLIKISGFTPLSEDLISVPYDFRSRQFTDLYTTVAFKDPNVKDTVPARMRYWKDGMRIYFADEVERSDVKGLTNFAQVISSKVDSLDISVVNKLEDANYVVYYKDHYDFEPRMNTNNFLDYYLYWKGAYINKGFLRVSKERYFNDAERLKLLKAYFFRTLGYFEPTRELGCGSYFSTCSDVSESLSQLDLELLQYHYSYGVCKGVTQKTYLEQLERAEEYRNKPRSKFFVSHHKSIFQK